MVSIQNINQQNSMINFKGTMAKTEQGNPYYKSNSATKIGCVMAVPAAIVHLYNPKVPSEEGFKTSITKHAEMYKSYGAGEDFLKAFNEKALTSFQQRQMQYGNKKKWGIPFAIVAAGMTAGCGMLVDNIRNKKAAATADFVKQNGVKKSLMMNDSVELSRLQKPYYKSKNGVQYGALLGAICGLTAACMKGVYVNSMKAGGFIPKIIVFSLGGLLLGAIADHNTNSKASKNT